jgi:signal transduction histidine kinase
VVVTLQQALWQTENGPRKKRLVFGLSIIIGLQIFLFALISLLSQGKNLNAALLFVLDRAFLSLLFIWSLWIWCFPAKNKTGDLSVVILNIVTVGVAIGTLYFANNNPASYYNQTFYDLTWELFFGIIVLFAMILLFRSKQSNWEFGFGFFLIQLIGILFHFGYADPNQNLSAIIRLSQMIAFPLMPALLREPILQSKKQQTKTSESENNFYPEVDRRRFSTDQNTFQTWLSVIRQEEPQKIGSELAHAIAQSMRVDLCLLTNAPEEFGDVTILCGYDIIRDQAVEGQSLAREKVSVLSNAISKGKPFWFSPQNAPLSNDIDTIKEVLKLNKLQNMLVIPLKNGDSTIGSVLLLSPYADRNWNDEDLSYISSAADQVGAILVDAFKKSKSNSNLKDYKNQLARAQKEIQTLSQENSTLEKRLIDLSEAKDTFSAAYQLEQLTNLQEESNETIERMQAEINRLENELIEKTTKDPEDINPASLQMEEEMKLMLEEVARLQNDIAEAKITIMTYEQINQDMKGVNEEEREVIQSIVQEIRQPMSSILGYTDLLLGESVGELVGLQRKFLEKIKSSNEKMRSLLDDLIHISTFEANKFEISRANINLSEIIDTAISDTSAQLQEKDISLQLDIPDELPKINVDKEAIQKVLTHLLENAGAATPNDGEITLHIKTEENEYDERYLMLIVEDTGGGIPEDLINKVFSRRYKAENPLIPGLGDTGVSLSIAKTLVEAHNGRIWVETIPEIGTQFSVLIPLDSKVA